MTYLEEGAEILVVGDDAHKRLRISIAQEDATRFRSLVGRPVRFRMRSSETREGRLERLIPRASKTPPHTALCAPLGGPLDATAQTGDDPEDSYELVVPRFSGIVELPEELGARLFAGEFVYVTTRVSESESMAQVLYRRVHDWVDKKWKAARSCSQGHRTKCTG
jgi:hypothetical protein